MKQTFSIIAILLFIVFIFVVPYFFINKFIEKKDGEYTVKMTQLEKELLEKNKELEKANQELYLKDSLIKENLIVLNKKESEIDSLLIKNNAAVTLIETERLKYEVRIQRLQNEIQKVKISNMPNRANDIWK